MSEPRICPNCKTEIPSDSPPGVCPYCALRAGFYSADATPGLPGLRPHVMPPEEVARHLPELDEFELIGSGGMGTVYRARQRQLGRLVAVKVLHSHLAAEPSFADRFTREAQTLARLDHPNIVRVYDCGHRDGLYYLVMELVEGVSLRHAIEAGGFEPKEALVMVPLVCAALQYAHDKGVVHRDIKPENILLDGSGSLKVADFGLAKLVGQGAARLTATEQVMGTPHYMAPEQIERPEQVDHRADIFALGVVFYEMLTGELPVGRFPPPSDKVKIDVRLDHVVLRTLEKEPDLRYQRASDLKSEVESLSSPGLASWGRWWDQRPGGRDPDRDLGMREPSGSNWDPGQGRQRSEARPDYEFRSKQTVLGVPLIHVASSRDPSGKRVRVARGIIAIGDIAIGGIAVGGLLSLGGVAVGGFSVGVISLGGITIGLLLALGGLALGTVAVGGGAAGIVSWGALSGSVLSLSEGDLERVLLAAWLVGTLAMIGATAAIILAYSRTSAQRRDEADRLGRSDLR